MKNVIYILALLCSSAVMSQEESALKFSQVLLVELTEEGVVVPEGKVWKVVSQQSELIYYHSDNPQHYFYLNDNRVDIVSTTIYSAMGFSQNQSVFPIWSPSNTILRYGSKIHTLSVIEFNTD